MKTDRQFELDMALPEIGRAGSVPLWTYRLTPDGLVEENERFRYVYGFWSCLFGCWEIDLETNKSREIVPKPIAPSRGGRFVGKGPPWHPRLGWEMNDYPPRWQLEAKAAFAGFFSHIPPHIRKLASSMGPYRWVALDLMWQVPGFPQFVEGEIFNDRQQYIYACLSLASIADKSRALRRHCAEAIMTRKRSKVLTSLIGTVCTQSTVNTIYKLDDEILPGSVYRNIAKAMIIPKAAKVLRHLEIISPEVPETLLDIPECYRLPNLFALSEEEPCSPRSMLKDIVEISNALHYEDRRRCTSALREVKDFFDLEAWCIRWQSVAQDRRPFPKPPIPGDDQLRPITDNRALRREGRRMRNCVAEYTEEILSESVYFYHWSGANPATVKIENNNEKGWCLSAVLGPRNSDICQWTYYLIAQRVWWQRHIILGLCDGSPPLMPGTNANQTERILMNQGQADAA